MNYFYKNFWYRWFLRNHRNDAQIVKQETQYWKANTIQWLTILFNSGESRKAYENIERLRAESNRLDAYLTTRDHNGVESEVALPILTPEESIRMNKGKRMHLFLLILLSLIDTFLFSLIAVYFMPPESGYGSKLIFGAVAALSIILCWEGGFWGILTYIKDKHMFKTGQINIAKSYLILIMGVLLLCAAIMLSISIGLVRMHVLEVVDTSTIDPSSKGLSNNMKEAGTWASVASMIFAFLTGILLGFSRIMTDTFGVRGAMFDKYNNSNSKISKLRNGTESFNTQAKNDVKDYIERNWKMVLYVRSKLRRDFDEEDKDLALEFKEVRKTKNLEYNDDLYNHFQDVQCMDERLFKFGIINSEAYINGHEKLNTMMEEYKIITQDLDHRHKVSNKSKLSTSKLLVSPLLILFFVFTLCFASCKEDVRKPASITVFMDWSTSLPEATKQFYIGFIYKVFTYLKPGDVIRILPIDKNTESGSVELVNLTIPPSEQFSNPLDPPAQKNLLMKIRFKNFYESKINTVQAGLNKLKFRDSKLQQGTDIFGALRLAQNYFDTSKTNILIICSDMLNYSQELKMEKVKLDRSFISNALKKLNSKYVNTAYTGLFCVTGSNDQLDASTYWGAKDFWTNYFQQANFKNTLYISGETSVVEQKLKVIQEIKTTKETSFF